MRAPKSLADSADAVGANHVWSCSRSSQVYYIVRSSDASVQEMITHLSGDMTGVRFYLQLACLTLPTRPSFADGNCPFSLILTFTSLEAQAMGDLAEFLPVIHHIFHTDSDFPRGIQSRLGYSLHTPACAGDSRLFMPTQLERQHYQQVIRPLYYIQKYYLVSKMV